jgi:uncharacterized protein with PIN domain
MAKHGGLGMTFSSQGRERIKEVARDLIKLVDADKKQTGRRFTFAELEDDSIEATDLLSQLMMEERLAQQNSSPQLSVCCPKCVSQIPRDVDEPRAMQTDRGEVTWTEPTYSCSTCRRAFFPGELSVGDFR